MSLKDKLKEIIERYECIDFQCVQCCCLCPWKKRCLHD